MSAASDVPPPAALDGFSDVPKELLETVFCQLSMPDVVRASAVGPA
jgi:hypothetical protein